MITRCARITGSVVRSGSSAAAAPAITQPDEPEHQTPDEQGADEGVEDPAHGPADVGVGELLAADHPREDPRAQDQVDDRDRGARRGDRERRSQDARRAGRARGGPTPRSTRKAISGATIPSQRMWSATSSELAGEVALLELQQRQVDALRQVVGELRVDRLEREAHDLQPVGDVEGDVVLVLVEQQPVRLAGRGRGTPARTARRRAPCPPPARAAAGRRPGPASPRSISWTTISVATTSRTWSSLSASTAWSANASASTISTRT